MEDLEQPWLNAPTSDAEVRNPRARNPKKPIRILIVDVHAMFREGLRALLKGPRDFRIAGEASDGQTALALVQQLNPDVLLLGVDHPRLNGADLLRHLSQAHSQVRVLALISDIDNDQTMQALSLGAHGILLKNSPSGMLYTAIRRVMANEHWVSPDVLSWLVQRRSERAQPRSAPVQTGCFGLTERELQVVQQAITGFSNPEIAKKLLLSEQTVKHHLTHAFDKLGVFNRVELVRFALSHGLDDAAKPISE